MMRDLLGWMVMAALVGGCAPAVGDIGDGGDDGDGGDGDDDIGVLFAGPGFEQFPAPADLCSWRRTVVYHPPGSCPAAAGWSAQPVFAGGEPELARYCRYRFGGAGEPTGADLAALPGNSPRSPDCLVVAPAAEEGWFTAHDAFLKQIDTPALEVAPPPAPAPATAWVAVIDTSPRSPLDDGEAWPGNDPHGHVLGRIVREVGCPDGASGASPCVIRVHHELALPLAFDGKAWSAQPGGGHFGYQTDLAAAIDSAVDAWSQGHGPGEHLVINLSLGWLEPFGGSAGDSVLELPPARGVYAAIEKAVCRGALVFAAAGNWSGGTTFADGPIYPAAWTRRMAPTFKRCLAFSGSVPGYTGGGRLVEAVGGIDGRDRPLGNAREASTPRIVAPGFLGTALDASGAPLQPLTGTSVSTAVASAAAAVAWAYVPGLAAPAVADAVYGSGPSLGRAADPLTCLGSCTAVRRVSTCGALALACSDGAGGARPGCSPAACMNRPAFADARPVLRAGMFRPPTEVDPLPALAPLVGVTPAACGVTTALYRPIGASGAGEAPCPDRQLYSGAAHPSVEPQPSGAGCTVCNHSSFGASMSIDVALDPAAVAAPIDYPSLLVTTSAGRFRYALWELPDGRMRLEAGPVYRITEIPRPPGEILMVRLSGRNARGQSWSAELIPLAGP